MWSPEKSKDLLNASASAKPAGEQWASQDAVRGRVVQAVLSANGGTLNGYHPQDIADLCGGVTTRLAHRRVSSARNELLMRESVRLL